MSEGRNRLGAETSPYLLQHAHNPVHWWPWGEEALAEAQHSNSGPWSHDLNVTGCGRRRRWSAGAWFKPDEKDQDDDSESQGESR